MNQDPWQTTRARSLRREMTPAEKILWAALRGRRFDSLKFRRQYPTGQYILDFHCPELLLALEIDGETHLGKEEHDEARTKAIEAEGSVDEAAKVNGIPREEAEAAYKFYVDYLGRAAA